MIYLRIHWLVEYQQKALGDWTKNEDKELVKRRIYEATKYIPLERLYLSPQCGFASCEIGNKLTEEQQWKKLKLVKEIAEKPNSSNYQHSNF